MARPDGIAGAHLVIQRTEALTAIDVNAGRSVMKKEGSDNDELARRVNIEAAKTVAKTLRLRDIGGLVMIDLIDMEDEGARREVEIAFESIAKKDRAQLTFLPISSRSYGSRQRTPANTRRRRYEHNCG